MNRNTAREHWAEISGWEPQSTQTIEGDLLIFLRQVATSLLLADDEKCWNTKRSAIVNACGLTGKLKQEGVALTEKHLQIHYDFSPLDENGNNLPYTDAARIRSSISFMRELNPGNKNIDDEALAKRIRRLIPKMSIPL